jgi:DNA-binding NarL/FixJ family response regulator
VSAVLDARLSPRQREVLTLLANGIRVREIAARLGLSQTTVRNHIRIVLRRLDCHSQLEAVARAREWRLI